jgi:hypothetical protein
LITTTVNSSKNAMVEINVRFFISSDFILR